MDGVALPGGSIVSVTGTQIVYVAPAHAAGSVTVTVAVNGTAAGGECDVHVRAGDESAAGAEATWRPRRWPTEPAARGDGRRGRPGGVPNPLPAPRP